MTGDSPRVSVIVPVRNRRDLLRRTLDALARQTLTDHEVVVVDDGSTDGSGDEARADAANGRPVRLLEGGGGGAVAARAAGVAAARAPVLAFTDSDCEPEPDWLAAGIAAIDAGADVVQGLTRPARRARPLERTVWSTFDDGLFATCNVFYRRDAFDRAGGFDHAAGERLGFRPGSRLRDLGFGEDTLLGWRVRRAGRAAFAPDAVVHHHVFGVDLGDTIRRTWTVGAFPALFREVPELDELLGPQFREQRWYRAPLYGAVASLAAGRPRWAAAATGAWVAARWSHLSRAEPSLARRVKVLPIQLALDGIAAAALVAGSARARKLLL